MDPIRILLIDDDEDDYVLTRDLLKDSVYASYYILDWSNNYSEGLNAIARSQYDIYLVDYLLGNKTGIDLLVEASRFKCDKPIIVLTGKGDDKIDKEALKLGAADYLVKDEISSSLLDRTIRYNYERYKNFQRLKDSETKFRMIFERSKDAMLISDINGTIHEANPAALVFFETTYEVLLQQNSNSFFRNKDLRDKTVAELEEKGSVTDVELELITTTGKSKYCSVSSFLQFQQEEKKELYYSVIHDLTDRKQKEQQLILEEKLSAIGRIAKNLATEVYNPLSNVNLAIDELRTNNHNQDEVLLLDLIKKNCDKINDLTSQLIECTDLASIKKKRIDFTGVVKRSVDEASGLFNLEIVSNISSESIWLNANESGLNSVLINIFQNAADAIHPDSGKVIVDVQQNPEGVMVEILDNGKGIAAENLDKVCEPFFTTKSRSSGLGLTYSQRIIKAHNGKLLINSIPHKGTSVSIILPS